MINNLKRYAELIVKSGINIQKDQILVVSASIECAPLIREITKTAYELGSKDVVINWTDDQCELIRYKHAPEASLEVFPDWEKELCLGYARQGAAFLSIVSRDPAFYQDVDQVRVDKSNRARGVALSELMTRKMTGQNAWCIAAYPSIGWAKKVFPTLSDDEAVKKLWKDILFVSRADGDDPITAWENHIKEMQKHVHYLNAIDFEYLVYKNALGTDLKVELADNHMWLTVSAFIPTGTSFCANIPSEEVTTLPKKHGVNGKVVCTKPLSYNGQLIDKITMRFENGRIVDYSAEVGYDILKHLIETDEGSHYLGEVALVPNNSPISKLNTIYYSTLIDENASCHFAFGKGYALIKNVFSMKPEEIAKLEVNDSLVHVDFMIGTPDLSIIGVTKNGVEIPVFKDGNFVLPIVS